MRTVRFAPEEYYHLTGRGVLKQKIFLDRKDFVRFLFLLLYFQSSHSVSNVGRAVEHYIREDKFPTTTKIFKKIINDRKVALCSFTLMPNHFHLLVQEIQEGGVSLYMQRILTAYAKYFNEKYDKSGHVFQGPFRAVHVDDNEQLLHLSAYIHLNQREIAGWRGKEIDYEWSSYFDYGKENRWGELLDQEILCGQFPEKADYIRFVKTSGVKK